MPDGTASHGREEAPRYADAAVLAPLTEAQMERVRRLGNREEVRAGDGLITPGQVQDDFIVVDMGEVEVAIEAGPTRERVLLARHGAGGFLGELDMLTGQSASLGARAVRDGVVIRLSRPVFNQMMREDADLSGQVLRSFIARRRTLQGGAGSHSVEVLGSRWCARSLALRSWAARQQISHAWLDMETTDGAALAAAIGVGPVDLPVVVTSSVVIRNATPEGFADLLGLAHRPHPGKVRDVIVIGGGPAGLAVAVCAASEGLDTLLLDRAGVGGQAAASARIENYVGFPAGITGADLSRRTLTQAHKFGAAVSSPCQVRALQASDGRLLVSLGSGQVEEARTVVIASGASYRKLDVPDLERYESSNVFYAATELEARTCARAPVVVVGGANSAGQASIFLADSGSPVTLVARGDNLGKAMSRYLVERIEAHPSITVRTGCQVTALHGAAGLTAVSLTEANGAVGTQPASGLFCFIGATPASEFLTSIALDKDGFVKTDRDLMPAELTSSWELLGRHPLPYETSVPGIFAVGDVRHGSVKRVAAAVGEGSAVAGMLYGLVHPENAAPRPLAHEHRR
jgi:thioredoxin reductase (NADPH)